MRWLHNQKYHFTFLQETYSSIECARIWEAEWGGKVFFSHGTTHSKGVMTLSNPTLDFKVEKSICDKNGRFLILDVAFDDTHFILANIYAPNDAKQQIVFFKDLQKHLGEFTSTFFKPDNISPLKEEEQQQCEGLVSENECLNALKEFKNAKSPGTDGFSAEFYKFFWPELGNEMVSSFNHAFRTGILSISQRRGIISLIPKKNKDKTMLET